MKIKCDYCGNYINDTDEVCPNCNGVNSHLVRNANGIPRTIEELRMWCQQNNIPLQDARFFIGEDYRGARAFGIYQDQNTGNFIVYKNKSDGTRAVRYEGKDEAYAVNEIFQKLKEEILNQKQHLNQPGYQYSAPYNSSNQKRRPSAVKIPTYITVVIVIVLVLSFFFGAMSSSGPDRGYYGYRNQTYYYQPGDGWFLYNNGYWNRTYVDDSLSDDYDDYYESSYYSNSYDADDFSDSSYYDSNSGNYDNDSYDNDWDSGWDSGDSWDSGYSDWGSDW